MQTHFPAEGTITKCGEFNPADEFTDENEIPSCISCRFHDDIQKLWEEYLELPSNFGEGMGHVAQMAEHDAFFAGAEKILLKVVPF